MKKVTIKTIAKKVKRQLRRINNKLKMYHNAQLLFDAEDREFLIIPKGFTFVPLASANNSTFQTDMQKLGYYPFDNRDHEKVKFPIWYKLSSNDCDTLFNSAYWWDVHATKSPYQHELPQSIRNTIGNNLARIHNILNTKCGDSDFYRMRIFNDDDTTPSFLGIASQDCDTIERIEGVTVEKWVSDHQIYVPNSFSNEDGIKC